MEGLLAELAGTADAASASRAEELVRLLMELYGAGLERVVELATDEGGPLLDRMGQDQLVGSLLVLHGLHPVPVEARIRQAMERCRPSAGTIEYLGVDDEGVAHLRVEGTCGTCPSSTAAVQSVVEQAVADAAPELAGVVFDRAAPPPAPAGNGVVVTLGTTRAGTAVPVEIGRARR